MTTLEKPLTVRWRATEPDVSREIWILGSMDQRHAGLVSALELAGFATRSFAGEAGILALAGGEGAPLAILGGTAMLGGLDKPALTRLQDTPAVLVGLLERDTLAERLQAARLGAHFCLTPPYDAPLLTDYLEEVAGEQHCVPWKLVLVSEDVPEIERLSVWFDARDLALKVVQDPDSVFAAIDEGEPDLILVGKLHSLQREELVQVIRTRNRLQAEAIHLLPEPDSYFRDDAGIDTLDLLLLSLGYQVDLVRTRKVSTARTLRMLQEHAHVRAALDTHAIMSITDLAGTITDVNTKFCEISGYAASELIGKSHSILKSGYHDGAFYARMWRAIRSGEVWQGEICNRRKDGSLYWVESTITPLHNAAGQPTGYMSLRTDITTTKTQQILLNGLAEISAFTDERFLEAAVAWLGKALDVRAAFIALEDAGLSAVVKPFVLWDQGSLRSDLQLQLPRALVAIQQSADGDPGVIESGLHERFADVPWLVERRISSCLSMAFRDSSGTILGHLVVMSQHDMPDWREKSKWLSILAPRLGNIVEASRSQQELRRREQQYRTLARNIPGMVYRAGADWHCEFITGCDQVCGYGESRFLSGDLAWSALIHPEDLDRVLGDAADLEKGPGTMIQQYRILHSDGSTRWVSDHKRSVFDDQSRFCGVDGVLFDITENNSISVENEMQRERLSRSQRYANIGTWDWNIETGGLRWTDRIPVLFGYAEGQLETSYENFITAIHAEDRKLVRDAVSNSIEHGVAYEVEHRVVWPDGTVRWLLERGDVIRDGNGKPVRMLGVVQDIDDRKRAELALAQRERELREAHTLAKLGSWSYDISSGAVIWSQELYRMFDADPCMAPPPYSEHSRIFSPESFDRLQQSLQNTLDTGEPYELQLQTVRADGSSGWMWVRGERVSDASGQPVELRGIAQDITALKRVEVALVERERLLRDAQALAHIGNWSADLRSGELFWSDEVFRIFGLAPASVSPSIGMFRAAVHPEDIDMVLQSEARALAGAQHDVIHRIIRPDGEIRHVHELAVFELDSAGTQVRLTGTVQDVTAQVHARQALLEARAEADAANLAKTEFLSSMSHELRTPMNSILGFAQLLELDTQLNPEQYEGVKEIRKAGSHLLNLINEILDLSRVESGAILLSLESVDLTELMQECLGLVKPLAEVRGVGIHVASVGDERLLADPTRLKQVLVNLLSNAIKYNRQGGMVLISGEKASDCTFRICVSDTGSGIPRESHGKIFQPFARVHADQVGIEGTGIGLAITQRLVHMMGGDINFDSTPGIGSSFWIELPVSTGSSGEAAAVDAVEAGPAGMTVDPLVGKLLLVDDNPANLRLVARILEPFKGLELLSAHSASLGLELARINQPDLILLDINMPDMDGYRMLGMIKNDPGLAAVPVLALTANALPGDIERGKNAGFIEYITKPIDVAGFVATVRQSLRQRRVHAGAGSTGCDQGTNPCGKVL